MTCFIFLLKFIGTLWSYNKCQKTGGGMTLGQVKIKNFVAQPCSDKIFGT